jgi:hypothetical protein
LKRKKKKKVIFFIKKINLNKKKKDLIKKIKYSELDTIIVGKKLKYNNYLIYVYKKKVKKKFNLKKR